MIVSVKLYKADYAVCGILYAFFKYFVFCFRDAGADVYFSARTATCCGAIRTSARPTSRIKWPRACRRPCSTMTCSARARSSHSCASICRPGAHTRSAASFRRAACRSGATKNTARCPTTGRSRSGRTACTLPTRTPERCSISSSSRRTLLHGACLQTKIPAPRRGDLSAQVRDRFSSKRLAINICSRYNIGISPVFARRKAM